jgi:hypothetical protein
MVLSRDADGDELNNDLEKHDRKLSVGGALRQDAIPLKKALRSRAMDFGCILLNIICTVLLVYVNNW